MKTSSILAGIRSGLLLLAIAVPMTTASAEDRSTKTRRAQEKPVLLNKMGNFFFKAARQTEQSMNTKPVPVSTGIRPASESRSVSMRVAASGLPSSVTLSPRNAASTTVIYTAPERTITGEPTDIEYTPPVPDTLNAPLQRTVQPVPQPMVTETPKPLPPLDRSKLPTATRSETMSRVVSPYPPHRELDVTGLPSGSLARDPSVGKVFIIP